MYGKVLVPVGVRHDVAVAEQLQPRRRAALADPACNHADRGCGWVGLWVTSKVHERAPEVHMCMEQLMASSGLWTARQQQRQGKT